MFDENLSPLCQLEENSIPKKNIVGYIPIYLISLNSVQFSSAEQTRLNLGAF